MSLKDILVHLDDPASGASALSAAIILARRHGAHITGLHAYNFDLPLMMLSGGYINPRMLDGFLEEGRRGVESKRQAAQALFEDAVQREGIGGDWRAVEGDIEGLLTHHARYADLIVFGRPSETGNPLVELAETVMFGAGRPILLVPPVLPYPTLGERVLIGWNGTREAARAVADALPLLRQAEAVHILSVAAAEPGEEGPGRLKASDLALHLSRHDVRVSAATVAAEGVEAQNVLLNAAADRAADLLVVGGYGRGRLRELILGGVTRSLFRQATIPVLFSH
jgi:nucleotide-binding universal stress UspA family protein